jgi:hypothetical protein
MAKLNVLSIQRINAADQAMIRAIDPAIELTDAGGWFDGEIRQTWAAFTSERYLQPEAMGERSRAERDGLLVPCRSSCTPNAGAQPICRGLPIS